MQEIKNHRRRQNIQHLLEAVDKVAGYTDKKEILQTTAITMVYLLQAETVLVSVWDSDTQRIVPEAYHTSGGWTLPASWYRPKAVAEHPLFQRVQSLGKSAQFNLGGMSLPLKILKQMEEAGIQSWVAFPLLGADQSILGIVDALDSREPRVFAEEGVAHGEMLAKLSSATYQRALLFEQSEKKGRQLNALVDIISSITHTRTNSSMPQPLATFSKVFVDLARADFCVMSFYHPDDGMLEPFSHSGLGSAEYVQRWQQPRNLAVYPLEAAEIFQNKVVFLQRGGPYTPVGERDLLEENGIDTLLIVPMVLDGALRGVIEIFGRSGRRGYSRDDFTLFRVLGEHLIHAVHHARVLEVQQLEHRFADALIESTRIMNSSLNLNEVLDRILDQIIKFTDGTAANIMLLDNQNARIVRSVGYEGLLNPEANQPTLTFPLTTPNLKKMYETRRSVLIDSTADAPDWVAVPGAEWIRSYIGAPLIVGGEVIGFLNMDADQPRFFTRHMLAPLEAFASIAASVLRNAQRYKSVQEKASELEIVRRAALSLTASLDLEDVLDAILKQSLELFAGPRDGHIFLYQGEQLHFGAARRGDGTVGEIWAEPRKDGLTYTVARTGLPMIVDDMRRHHLFENTQENWTGSIVGLPLKYGGDVVGVMNIAHEHPNQFKDHHLRILNLLADQAAIAIVNARLHHLVQEQSLTDPLTGLHNRRAFNLRLNEETLRTSRYGRPFSLALLDLNDFKHINDTHGHLIGDQVLVRVGTCLLENVRKTDFLARYGGDEFAIIMPETSYEAAVDLTSRLQQVLEKYDLGVSNAPDRPVTLSVGVAEFPTHGQDFDQLIGAADRGLYDEKGGWQEGGDQA